VMSRARDWLAAHLDAPLQGLPRDDADLVSVMADLSVRSEREPGSREAMELNFLQLEQAAIEGQIDVAQRQGGDPPVELQRRRAELAERIELAASGNPLFIEEMAAWMLERDGTDDELPTTVRAMIAARLDALPREERDVLFDASVVGKVFWAGPLASLRPDEADLDEILGSLERRDLIRLERASAVEGDDEYTFRHILIRDVAYATIPRRARRERHEAVARYVEEAAPDAAAVAAILAYHWREAGDTERAVTYLLIAAERAEQAWAYPEAVALYEDALGLIPKDDDRRRSIGLRRSVAGIRHEHTVMDEEQLKRLAADGSS